MASTLAAQRLTQAHRAQQLAVRAGSLQNLVAIWNTVDVTDLQGTIETFARAAAIIAGQGFQESSIVASNYYGLFRRVEGVGGTAPMLTRAARPTQAALAAELRGAALSGIVKGRRAGMTVQQAGRNGFARAAGALSKLVLAGGQQTIIGIADNDRRALGWARVTSSGACAFCRMLASRGPAYKSEKSADFQTHDDCACSVEPVYAGDENHKQAAKFAKEFDAAQQWARDNVDRKRPTSNNALNNYRRYLADQGTATPSPVTEASGQ